MVQLHKHLTVIKLLLILSVYFNDKQKCRNRLLRAKLTARFDSALTGRFPFPISFFSVFILQKSKRALQLSDTSPVKREVAGSSPAVLGYDLTRSSVGRALIILMMILSRLLFYF